jgi:hypothetical protein
MSKRRPILQAAYITATFATFYPRLKRRGNEVKACMFNRFYAQRCPLSFHYYFMHSFSVFQFSLNIKSQFFVIQFQA